MNVYVVHVSCMYTSNSVHVHDYVNTLLFIYSQGLQVTFVCWSVKSATRASLDLNSCSYSHEDF